MIKIISILLFISYCGCEISIVTNNAECTFLGKKIFKLGGTLVDSAIGIMLCEGLVSPQDSGIGGGFTGLVSINNENFMINAREKSPKKINSIQDIQPMYHDIGIPGALRGYELLHEKWGKLKLEKIFSIVSLMCHKGLKVTEPLERAIKYTKKDFNFLITNNTVKNEKLCYTLDKIGYYGIDFFYNNISYNIVNDIKLFNNKISVDDFKKYKAKLKSPSFVRIDKENIDVYSTNYPGVGRLLVDEIEKMFYIGYNLIEDQKSFYSKIPQYRYKIMNKKIAKRMLKQNKRIHGTTNICIQHSNDSLCITSTINQYFGSGFYSDSTGIILNNQLRDFPYYYKNISSTTPPSFSSVVMIRKENTPLLMLGGTGGYRIPSGVLNVLSNVIVRRKYLKKAIAEPRVFSDERSISYECTLDGKCFSPLLYPGTRTQYYSYNSYNTVTGIHSGVPVFDPRRGGLGLSFFL